MLSTVKKKLSKSASNRAVIICFQLRVIRRIYTNRLKKLLSSNANGIHLNPAKDLEISVTISYE